MAVDTRQLLIMLPQVISLISEASKLIPAAGAVPRYLDTLSAIVGHGTAAYDDLMTLRALVKAMVQQQREPTADEWTAMQARSDIASAKIQAYDFDKEEPAT